MLDIKLQLDILKTYIKSKYNISILNIKICNKYPLNQITIKQKKIKILTTKKKKDNDNFPFQNHETMEKNVKNKW